MRRFHLYAIDKNCNLLERVTKALYGEDLAEDYYHDCQNCAMVEIDEFGTLIGIVKWKYSNDFAEEDKRMNWRWKNRNKKYSKLRRNW